MGLFASIGGFFSGGGSSEAVSAPMGQDATFGQDHCTASGSEPTWHNGFGTQADFSTLNDPFGNSDGIGGGCGGFDGGFSSDFGNCSGGWDA